MDASRISEFTALRRLIYGHGDGVAGRGPAANQTPFDLITGGNACLAELDPVRPHEVNEPGGVIKENQTSVISGQCRRERIIASSGPPNTVAFIARLPEHDHAERFIGRTGLFADHGDYAAGRSNTHADDVAGSLILLPAASPIREQYGSCDIATVQ
jgi:hypothetical protein